MTNSKKLNLLQAKKSLPYILFCYSYLILLFSFSHSLTHSLTHSLSPPLTGQSLTGQSLTGQSLTGQSLTHSLFFVEIKLKLKEPLTKEKPRRRHYFFMLNLRSRWLMKPFTIYNTFYFVKSICFVYVAKNVQHKLIAR